MYKSLGAFIEALERAGELTRIAAPVSPILEIAAIADRESKAKAPSLSSASAQRNDPAMHDRGGRALLFERVEGSDIPLLINAYGSYKRMEMALGCHDQGHTPGGFDALGARIGALTKPEPPSSLRDLFAKARQFAPLLRIPPRTVSRAACQEVVRRGAEIDLTRLPLIKCWPLDGDLASVGYPAGVNEHINEADLASDPNSRGRYITFAGIHTIHADDLGTRKPSSHNIGMYRVQLVGRRHLAMHWHLHHDGARHWRSWKKRGERMPIAIAFGGESVLPFAAIAPLPPGVSELLFAGFLNRGGIPMRPAVSVPLRVPANAEIVIEGWVSHEAGPPGWDPRDPGAGPLGPGAFFEGPFGDHTGFYSLPDRYPLVEVTAVTTRRNAVFPATVVGLPPQEDYPMGKCVERIFLPLLRTIVHDVDDYDLPVFGAFHNAAFIKIHKEYALQARRLMHSIWGAGQMAWTKLIAVVDDDVDVHDAHAVLRAIGERCDPDARIEHTHGPLDILDHAAPALGAGGKIGFDATREFEGERESVGAAPAQAWAAMPEERVAHYLDAVRSATGALDARLPAELGRAWLLLRLPSADDDHAARRALEAALGVEHDGAPRYAIALGESVSLDNLDTALFHWTANSDPARDSVRAPGRLAFDATPKRRGAAHNNRPVREWPPVIEMDDRTLARVEARRTELFPHA